MKRYLLISILVLLGFAANTFASTSMNNRAIALVKSEKGATANASWWGFDSKDSTKALQAAINSGAKTVVVPNMGKPWIVTPIKLASNQTIIFEKGVVILAKKGAFKDKHDMLFTAVNKKNITIKGYGATWRMRKKDYDSDAYAHSEWRHALALLSCTNVTIEGLHIESSGGDGIYIGVPTSFYGVEVPDKFLPYCKNITIKNVVFNDNYRQGVSVISVDNLLMGNVVMSNTGGTRPMAGIDFEPNRSNERLSNIVLKNCITKNNRGGGYSLYLVHLHENSYPVSIKFIGCKSIGDTTAGVRLGTSDNPARTPRGTITFKGCAFIQSRGSGITITNKSSKALKVKFINCKINNSQTHFVQPILFVATASAIKSIGGVLFKNCRVTVNGNQPPLGYIAHSLSPLENITGQLIIGNKSNWHVVKLSPKLIKKWMPTRDFARINYVSMKGTKLNFTVPQYGQHNYKFRDVDLRGIRGTVKFACYANKGDDVKLKIRYGRVTNFRGDKLALTVSGPHGRMVYKEDIPFDKVLDVDFIAPISGVYLIKGNPGYNYLRVESGNHPVSIVTTKKGVDLFNSGGSYYFWVPKGNKQFAIQAEGQGQGEGFRMVLINPVGKVVRDVDNIIGLSQITISPNLSMTGGVWEMQVKHASGAIFEDQTIRLLGIPPLLAFKKQSVIRTKN